MADRYTTHNVFLESADFNILIIEFPEADVNDKLSLLATEKGLIYKHFYEDFVLGTCMANSGPFFYHIRRRPELLTKFDKIRNEALSLVFRYSAGFEPNNIVINQNNVLKTKASVHPDETVRLLTENDLWDQDPPLSSFGPAVITSAPSKDNPFREGGEDFEEPDSDATEVPSDPDNPFVDNSNNGSNHNDVPYELVGHRWEKLGLHINVRQYEEGEENLSTLLGGAPFESARGYHLLIVQLCIEDFSDIFHLLDKQGISKKAPPHTLMAELYEISIQYNPFLKLEDVDLRNIRKEYKNKQRSNPRNNRRISAAGADDRIIRGKKRTKFVDLSKEKLLKLSDEIKKKIIGQDEAVALISDAVLRASVGLKREHEPLGVFLFTGNTGVGKTETAKALAEALGAGLVRVDCQEYQQPHEVAKLTGSPPGYVGYDDGGHLTKDILKNPFSVILFDEIEKAHSNFHERVLQIIDDGILTDNKNKKVSFKDTIIIMTSNIGVKEVSEINKTLGFGDVAIKTEKKTNKAREEALKKKFKPEFLNRIDETVHFRVLEKDDYLHILDILLEEVNKQIQDSKAILLAFNTGAKNFLLDNGIDKKFGARPLRRTIKKHLNTPLAMAILKDEIKEGSKVVVSLKKEKDGLCFRAARRAKKTNGD